jgi:hypothetical protein
LLGAEERGDRRASVRLSAELSVRLSKARTGIADSRATVVRRDSIKAAQRGVRDG